MLASERRPSFETTSPMTAARRVDNDDDEDDDEEVEIEEEECAEEEEDDEEEDEILIYSNGQASLTPTPATPTLPAIEKRSEMRIMDSEPALSERASDERPAGRSTSDSMEHNEYLDDPDTHDERPGARAANSPRSSVSYADEDESGSATSVGSVIEKSIRVSSPSDSEASDPGEAENLAQENSIIVVSEGGEEDQEDEQDEISLVTTEVTASEARPEQFDDGSDESDQLEHSDSSDEQDDDTEVRNSSDSFSQDTDKTGDNCNSNAEWVSNSNTIHEDHLDTNPGANLDESFNFNVEIEVERAEEEENIDQEEVGVELGGGIINSTPNQGEGEDQEWTKLGNDEGATTTVEIDCELANYCALLVGQLLNEALKKVEEEQEPEPEQDSRLRPKVVSSDNTNSNKISREEIHPNQADDSESVVITHREPEHKLTSHKNHYSSSMYFDDKRDSYPTIERQVEQSRRLASALSEQWRSARARPNTRRCSLDSSSDRLEKEQRKNGLLRARRLGSSLANLSASANRYDASTDELEREFEPAQVRMRASPARATTSSPARDRHRSQLNFATHSVDLSPFLGAGKLKSVHTLRGNNCNEHDNVSPELCGQIARSLSRGGSMDEGDHDDESQVASATGGAVHEDRTRSPRSPGALIFKRLQSESSNWLVEPAKCADNRDRSTADQVELDEARLVGQQVVSMKRQPAHSQRHQATLLEWRPRLSTPDWHQVSGSADGRLFDERPNDERGRDHVDKDDAMSSWPSIVKQQAADECRWLTKHRSENADANEMGGIVTGAQISDREERMRARPQTGCRTRAQALEPAQGKLFSLLSSLFSPLLPASLLFFAR